MAARFAERGTTIILGRAPEDEGSLPGGDADVAVFPRFCRRAASHTSARLTLHADHGQGMDQDGNFVTVLVVDTPWGGIPVAALVCERKSRACVRAGLQAWKEALGPNGFGGQTQPTYGMTDDDTALAGALSDVLST